jgi:PPOX class probable F420-dependent enzyme
MLDIRAQTLGNFLDELASGNATPGGGAGAPVNQLDPRIELVNELGFVVATDDDGALIVSTSETAAKTANLRRHPRAALCLFTDQFFGPWYQAEGPVTIESLPEAMEDLVRYYRLVLGEHPDWDDYRSAMVRERRVLLRLQIERVSPSKAG